MRRLHDDEAIREALDRNNYNMRKAAEELGYKSWSSIQGHMKRMGIAPRRRKIGDSHNLIVSMSGSMSAREIAQELGHHEEGLRKYMVRHNIPRLPQKARKEKNYFWNGGVHVDKHGYRLISMREHPDANRAGYVREHRLVMEEYLGRRLSKREVVHHIDGDAGNNSIDNLRLYASNGEHLRDELSGRKREFQGGPYLPAPIRSR